jgi:hypothetical protein
MNIHKYQNQIQDLLRFSTRKSNSKNPANADKIRQTYRPGCYIISRTLENNLFKLGEAHGQGGLYQRIIGQYKICMSLNSEFFLRYLVIAHRKKNGTKSYSQILEKNLLKTIDSKVEDSYSKEYIFVPKISTLEDRIGKVLKENKDLYETAIKFDKDGFHFYDEAKGFNTPSQDFKHLPNLNPNVKPLLNLYKQANAAKILTLLKKAKPKPVVAKVVKGKPVAKVVKPKIVLNMKRKPKDESRKRK